MIAFRVYPACIPIEKVRPFSTVGTMKRMNMTEITNCYGLTETSPV